MGTGSKPRVNFECLSGQWLVYLRLAVPFLYLKASQILAQGANPEVSTLLLQVSILLHSASPTLSNASILSVYSEYSMLDVSFTVPLHLHCQPSPLGTLAT